MEWVSERIRNLRWHAPFLMTTRPQFNWAYDNNTMCDIINRVYLHKFLKTTSYELIIGNEPNDCYLRVFGSPFHIHDMNYNCKFAPKAHEGSLLGYGSNKQT